MPYVCQLRSEPIDYKSAGRRANDHDRPHSSEVPQTQILDQTQHLHPVLQREKLKVRTYLDFGLAFVVQGPLFSTFLHLFKVTIKRIKRKGTRDLL